MRSFISLIAVVFTVIGLGIAFYVIWFVRGRKSALDFISPAVVEGENE